MLKSEIKTLRIKYIIADLLTGALAFLLFDIARYHMSGIGQLWPTLGAFLGNRKVVLEQCLIPFGLLLFYALSGFYNKPVVRSRIQELVTTFFSATIVTAVLYLALLVNDLGMNRATHYKLVLVMFGLFFVLTYAGRYVITTATFRAIRRHKWHFNTIIVGNSRRARKLAKSLRESRSIYGYTTIGFVNIEGEHNVRDEAPVLTLDQIPEAVARHDVDQIIIVPEGARERTVLKYLGVLYPLPAMIRVAADSFSYLTSNIRLQDVFGEPLLEVSAPAMDECGKNLKRISDICISAVALAVLAIPMAIVAVAIRRDSPGPVFYSQERVGYRRRKFNIYKFRTMCRSAEADGPRLSSPDDSRVTRVGRFLRKYRIDELPQFWNVLKGDMSLVGPRPEREYYIERIVKTAPYYTLLQQVRPGVTSWGMVKFGYARTVPEMVERSKYDLLYLSNMSLTVDLKIMIYTIRTVLSGRGM